MSRLIMRRHSSCGGRTRRTPRPTRTRIRADTRRLSSLDEQNGEQEMLRDGRDGQRNEGAPLLERGRLRDHDESDAGRSERDRAPTRRTMRESWPIRSVQSAAQQLSACAWVTWCCRLATRAIPTCASDMRRRPGSTPSALRASLASRRRPPRSRHRASGQPPAQQGGESHAPQTKHAGPPERSQIRPESRGRGRAARVATGARGIRYRLECDGRCSSPSSRS